MRKFLLCKLSGKRKFLCGSLYTFPVGIYLMKGNNRNTRTRCEICSKLTIKTPERRQWPAGFVFLVFHCSYHKAIFNVNILFCQSLASLAMVICHFFDLRCYSWLQARTWRSYLMALSFQFP